MPIEPHRIVGAKNAKSSGYGKHAYQAVPRTMIITNTVPPEDYVIRGTGTMGKLPAETEGQLVMLPNDATRKDCFLYCTVDVDGQGTLEWKPVTPYVPFIDSRTGKAYDPMIGIVNPNLE